jgi:hypothetical protein
LRHPADERFSLLALGDVGREDECPPPQPFDLAPDPFEFVGASCGEGHVCVRPRERHRRLPADPPGGTGDERDRSRYPH